MAQNITAAAAAIAAQIETLTPIGKAYPYPKPINVLEEGDAAMALVGTSLPETFGPETQQTCIWALAVKLGSAVTKGAGVEDLQVTIAELMSADPETSIIGLFRSDRVDALLRPHGSPRVTEDGVEASYGEESRRVGFYAHRMPNYGQRESRII